MRIVMVSSEVQPFSLTGGLGVVCGELSAALVRAGHTVVTVSPRYGTVDRAFGEPTGISAIVMGAGTHQVTYRYLKDAHGVHHLLVEHGLFDRPGIYGDVHGTFGDNHLRYNMLCRAAIEAARLVPIDGEPLGEEVVFHCHDWQGSLVPVVLEAHYRPAGLLKKASTVLTIHNLKHQGRFAGRLFGELDLPESWFAPWGLEYYSDVNLFKAGLLHADQITTVSPTYAQEVRTHAGGFGLDGVLRSRNSALTGILNGIDPALWDPETDPSLPAKYSFRDLSGKAECKAGLQAELDLPIDARIPIVGSVGRLDPQKGIGLIIESIPWLVENQGCQVVLLGSAAPAHRHYEHQLRELEHRYPRAVRSWIGFNLDVAHRIEAGADLFLMPSQFEPCGLSQMYSQRYGTPPVVRATGGLADSVDPVGNGEGLGGTGWMFHLFDGHSLREALFKALSLWRDAPQDFREVMRRGMVKDFSWDGVVPHYEAVYAAAAARRGGEVAT